MKKIEVIVKPVEFEGVKSALEEVGIARMTVSEVKAFGRQKAHWEIFRGSEYSVDYLPEIKMEMQVPDNRLEAALAAIGKAAKLDGLGDDHLMVSTIENSPRGNSAGVMETAV